MGRDFSLDFWEWWEGSVSSFLRSSCLAWETLGEGMDLMTTSSDSSLEELSESSSNL